MKFQTKMLQRDKLCLIITAALIASATAHVQFKWFEQKLDHFNDSDTRTWRMRYSSDEAFFKPGGPLFIYVGGGTFLPFSIASGQLINDMASEHSGYLFHTEHRFYGRSRPVDSMTNDNLKYLNAKQALADLAHFIRSMRSTIAGMSDSKVILVGSSYGGSLVTWFKRLYPDLANGGWASSAPLLAKADFSEFKEVMGDSIKQLGGASCYNRIQSGIAALESLFANKRGAQVKAMLRLCDSFDENNGMDVATLFDQISDLFAFLVQTHKISSYEIEWECESIAEAPSDISGITNFIVRQFASDRTCKDASYQTLLNTYRNTTFSGRMARPWTYQTCNEFGWFQTSSSRHQPFGTKYPLSYFQTLCADAFGSHFTPEYIEERIRQTNQVLGGARPAVENVYWSYGALDPWRAAGIQNENLTSTIPECSHNKDLGSIADFIDSPEMVASKTKVMALVRQWLS